MKKVIVMLVVLVSLVSGNITQESIEGDSYISARDTQTMVILNGNEIDRLGKYVDKLARYVNKLNAHNKKVTKALRDMVDYSNKLNDRVNELESNEYTLQRRIRVLEGVK